MLAALTHPALVVLATAAVCVTALGVAYMVHRDARHRRDHRYRCQQLAYRHERDRLVVLADVAQALDRLDREGVDSPTVRTDGAGHDRTTATAETVRERVAEQLVVDAGLTGGDEEGLDTQPTGATAKTAAGERGE